MIGRFITRRRRRGERGQAIVLGAVGLFIMALGVIATLNIGQAVSQRIRLQNAADAAAYSLAAEEARLFNFFAFTNRAQVAHYSAAMTVHSYISFLTYAEGIYGSLRDLLWDAASIYQCICDLNITYPPISPPYCALARAVGYGATIVSVLTRAVEEALNVSDGQAADLVEAMHLLNRAIWRAQLQQGLMINLLLTSGGYPYVEANNEAVDFGIVNGFNAVFNQMEFNDVFDRGAGMNFSLIGILSNMSDIWSPRIHDEDNDDDDVIAARQLMTEIANASRHGPGSRSRDTFVTDRSDTMPPLTYLVAGFGYLGAIPSTHAGQTRLVSPGGESGGWSSGLDDEVELDLPIEQIRDDSDYFTGTVIASDDYLSRDRIGNVSTTIYYAGQSDHVGAAVLSDVDGGGHYGYDNTDDLTWSSGTMRLPPDIFMLVSFNPLETACALACCSQPEETFPDSLDEDYEDHDDDIHHWDGIVAYPKFNPNPDQTADYHQPSTWIFLNLPPENFNRFGAGEGSRPWSMDFEYTFGSRTVTLDTTPGTGDSALLPFLRGLNALSRGQAYYHRPRPRGTSDESNWQEHPNFFNPFWRARLAPIGLKLKQLYDRFVSEGLHTEAGANVVLSAGVNLIRNMMGEVFFHTVTSVITH